MKNASSDPTDPTDPPALSRTREVWRALKGERAALALHVIVNLIVACSFGFSYKIFSQQSYLLGGLRRLDPSYLSRDWLFEQTTLYHPNFEWVVWILGKIFGGGDGLGWALVALQVVVIALTAGAFSRLCYGLSGRSWRRALLPQLVVALWIVAQLHWGPAFSYVTGYGMQPSTLSSLGFCWAMAMFALGRRGWAGFALAFSGLFHVNYLVLGLLVFGLAQLAEMARRREPLIAEGFKLLAPGAIVLLTFLPMLLDVSSQDEHGLWISHHIRAPWHYEFSYYVDTIWAYFAWSGLGLVSFTLMRSYARRALERTERESWTRLMILWVMLQICVLIYCVLVREEVSSKVTQLFVWRLAPYASMVSAMALCFALRPLAEDLSALYDRLRGGASAWTEGRTSRDVVDAVSTSLFIPAACVWMAMRLIVPVPVGFDIKLGLTIWGLMLGLLFVVHLFGRARRHVRLFIVTSLIAIAALSTRSCEQFSNAPSFEVEETDRRELYAWIRANTARDALFMIPPLMSDFRVYAERSLIVDWKTPPMIPNETILWYERIEEVSGTTNPLDREEVERGYRDLDAARLRKLALKYGFDHAVVHAESLPRLSGFTVRYKNHSWAVIEL